MGRPSRVVNIVDLPRRASSPSVVRTAAATAPVTTSPSGRPAGADAFRLVSATEPVDASTGGRSTQEATGFSAAARYGHEPSYAWLRGRLEFSLIDQQWKLRYIPVDGETDDYGGSVVLADESKLTGCERGDFVEIHGKVLGGQPASGFSPRYEVESLKRLSPSQP
jgi:hypothetical protein